MFEVGDIVRFRKTGVANKMRAKPGNYVALVVSVDREVYHSYSGDLEDRVHVVWLGTEVEECMPEFYLEKVEEE